MPCAVSRRERRVGRGRSVGSAPGLRTAPGLVELKEPGDQRREVMDAEVATLRYACSASWSNVPVAGRRERRSGGSHGATSGPQ